jgi:hypothetical protein
MAAFAKAGGVNRPEFSPAMILPKADFWEDWRPQNMRQAFDLVGDPG